MHHCDVAAHTPGFFNKRVRLGSFSYRYCHAILDNMKSIPTALNKFQRTIYCFWEDYITLFSAAYPLKSWMDWMDLKKY